MIFVSLQFALGIEAASFCGVYGTKDTVNSPTSHCEARSKLVTPK
jgi:hypothetical protein